MKSFFWRRAGAPLLLVALCVAFWARVLFTGRVLLPGAMLSGFAPFGNDARAPWTILQWDALAQYFPWRHFAAQSLRAGQIPLWNPLQFCGAPLLANAQSAVFYPLNWPFWVFDTAYAFGVAALEHSMLASLGTYFLARRWGMSRAAAVVSATIYAFCGYLSAWALLPPLFATASWLPLCLLYFERATEDAKRGAGIALALCLACALLAGHAQIFFYLILALALRQAFTRRPARALAILLGAGALGLALGAVQLLPTLELARLGHRAGGPPSGADWEFWRTRALQWSELPSLLLANWPLSWGTLSENFGYIGIGAALLAGLGLFAPGAARAKWFALALTLFGLLYALATPLAQVFFFGVPGVSQMGGTGRALLLWSLGAALLAGFGLDWGRTKIKSPVLPFAALLIVGAELGSNALIAQPTAPRAQIYPPTQLTTWLADHSGPNARVLFWTPQNQWLPTEAFRREGLHGARAHPSGVLPPNGAMVYGIHDVNGYDSLSPRGYRSWLGSEGGGPSPALNGNMVLLNSTSPALLDSLGVRYVVTTQDARLPAPPGRAVLRANQCTVWERELQGMQRINGANFYPGWRDGRYQPETFRLGAFVSLCALAWVAGVWAFQRQAAPGPTHRSQI